MVLAATRRHEARHQIQRDEGRDDGDYDREQYQPMVVRSAHSSLLSFARRAAARRRPASIRLQAADKPTPMINMEVEKSSNCRFQWNFTSRPSLQRSANSIEPPSVSNALTAPRDASGSSAMRSPPARPASSSPE